MCLLASLLMMAVPAFDDRANAEKPMLYVAERGNDAWSGERPEKDGWVHGYWFHDWRDQRHPIARIDPHQRVLEVKPPYHSSGYRKDRWFYGFNLLCELDRPGEWYLDREAGVLYFWPPPGASAPHYGDATVSIVDTLVTMKDASHVTVRGFTLEACRGTAVTISGGAENRIAGCLIRELVGQYDFALEDSPRQPEWLQTTPQRKHGP